MAIYVDGDVWHTMVLAVGGNHVTQDIAHGLRLPIQQAEDVKKQQGHILNAYYLPGGGDRQLYPSISPVNSFRVILNAYFDTKLPLLDDATYFTSHRLEDQAIDISAQRSSRANCNLP